MSVLNTYKPRVTEDLPVEVLSRILECLLPAFQVDANPKGIRAFRRKIEPFGVLRLVSSKWRQIATPLFFRGVVLVTYPSTSVDFIARFFDLRAPHVQSIMFYGDELRYGNDRDDNGPGDRSGVADAVGMGLSRCAKLVSIQCDNLHPCFLDDAWTAKFAPNFSETVTSISIGGFGISEVLTRVLATLGSSLERLRLSGWQSIDSSFHVPDSLPNIRHLELQNFNDRVPVKELVHCIAGNPSSSLRSLHVPVLHQQYWEIVSDILSINDLGTKLTSVFLYLGQWSQLEPLVAKIMTLCRNLVDFTYISPFPKSQLNCLPPSIRRLRLLIGNDEWGVTALDIIHILKARQCPQLEILELETRDIRQLENPELLSYFKDTGIVITSTLWVPVATSYMTLQLPLSLHS